MRRKSLPCQQSSLLSRDNSLSLLLATNKYNLLVQEGKWGTKSPDEENIIAMQAELTALKG
jgi:hypothetical protein